MRTALAALLLLAGGQAHTAPSPQQPELPPVPSDAECRSLPGPLLPPAFAPGETLELDLDAMGANAGSMTMRVLPVKDGLLPLQVDARTHTFLSKLRRIQGTGTSFVHPRTLRPRRYLEDSVENEVARRVEVTFTPRSRRASVSWRSGGRAGPVELTYGGTEPLDIAGAVYLVRQLPLKEGQPLCVDVYGGRRMWRLFGKVAKKEHVSLPVGEFEAWHLEATAARLDAPRVRRDVHVWISADDRRLPLAAVGTTDLGVMRATLTAYSRPGAPAVRSEGAGQMKW